MPRTPERLPLAYGSGPRRSSTCRPRQACRARWRTTFLNRAATTTPHRAPPCLAREAWRRSPDRLPRSRRRKDESGCGPTRSLPAPPQDLERERIEPELMRVAIFGQPAGLAPDPSVEVKVLPTEIGDLVAARRRRDGEAHEIAEDQLERLLASHPDQRQIPERGCALALASCSRPVGAANRTQGLAMIRPSCTAQSRNRLRVPKRCRYASPC